MKTLIVEQKRTVCFWSKYHVSLRRVTLMLMNTYILRDVIQ